MIEVLPQELHARLSPSNKAWPHCPGSIREQAKYPDIPNDAAIDGTGTHILVERSIIENNTPEAYKGMVLGAGHHDKPKGWFIDTDRIKRAMNVIAYIDRRKRELSEQYKGCVVKVVAETKSNPGRFCGRDDWFGTADVTIIVENVHGSVLFLEIADLKDGRIFVPVKDNTQLTSYLAGKVFELGSRFKGNQCRMTIIQPKTKPIVRYEDVSMDTLVIRYRKLEESAKRTDDPNAPLIPDDKKGNGYCRWCKHRKNCEALNEKALENMTKVVKKENTVLTLLADVFSRIETMTGEELSELLKCKKTITDKFKQAETEAVTRLNNGQSVGHYRMKPGKGSNVWKIPEEKMAKVLSSRGIKKDEMYQSTFISVAQALKHEKLTKKQKETLEKDYVTYTPGKPTLSLMSQDEIDNLENNEVMDLMREASEEVKQQAPVISFL